MADISTDQLDAGTDSPAVARLSLLEAVRRVNDFTSSEIGKGAEVLGARLGDGTPGSIDGALREVRAGVSDVQAGLSDTDAIQQLVADLAAGVSASAAVFGDSTMWGADPANLNAQVALPPPLELQNFVNLFIGNNAFTVVNSAVSGSTAAQMIAGTDGSGQTFAARIAASPVRVVFCNHGVNDSYGPTATTPAVYRSALISFVKIVRLAGKTPVLITPHPSLTIGGFGSLARSESTGRFAQIMREVAAQHGVTLVDNHRYFSLMMGNDANLPLVMFPDGVHSSPAMYAIAGNNLAGAILGDQVHSFTCAGQRMPASGAAARATGYQISATQSSRVGVVAATGITTPQTLRVLFRVERPGLDIVLSHPIFSSGAPSISVGLDGLSIGALGFVNWSQYAPGFSSTFWHDFETVMVRNCNPGFHILHFQTFSAGGIGIHALRSREAEKPTMLPTGFAESAHFKLLSAKLEMTTPAANSVVVFDDMPASRFLDPLELEWTSQMLPDSAVVIGGNIGSNGVPAVASKALFFGLNGSGFLSVWESTGPASFAVSVIGAINLSTASHVYRVKVSSAAFGVVTLWVDDVQVGTVNLTLPYYGGLVGLWKNAAGGRLTVTNVFRVWRL